MNHPSNTQIDSTVSYLCHNLTPTTLASMAADLIESHSISGNGPDNYKFDDYYVGTAYNAIRQSLIANVGEEEADEMIEASRL